MPPRARIAIAGLIALGALFAAIALAVNLLRDDADPGGVGQLFAATSRAAPPFDAFDEARVAVGDEPAALDQPGFGEYRRRRVRRYYH